MAEKMSQKDRIDQLEAGLRAAEERISALLSGGNGSAMIPAAQRNPHPDLRSPGVGRADTDFHDVPLLPMPHQEQLLGEVEAMQGFPAMPGPGMMPTQIYPGPFGFPYGSLAQNMSAGGYKEDPNDPIIELIRRNTQERLQKR